ncbi:eukaryotic translation initiation factor 6 [Beauveria brongniartii RCEF 3172]|uniref:Eukaryotic translation initiation factor 6 n=1 Tax=Beauveria brongniartii RCEF 3172 TaxID=1081107 RepID=A0A166YHU8_9HYPO|nr:eukaryotic translation initiation factor 6 [Beauveria brongniartii RCEF 3172]
MSWQNSNNPSRRPPDPRRAGSRPNDEAEYPLPGLVPASNTATSSNPAPLPRMIAAARERLASSNRDRIDSILGDSPFTTRRWTPSPGADAQEQQHPRQNRLSPPPSRYEVAHMSTSSLTVPPPWGQFEYPNRMTSLEQLDRTLDEANAHLRALLDMTSANSVSRQLLPTTQSSNYTPPIRRHDFNYDNQRNKRRKVDDERYTHATVESFRYGHYGQVEAGDLEMEMVSCDGGMFSNELSYAAENILKNDNSVYCTKGNRCNIVLRHRGSTTFTLSELVIKAPGSMNYSHPVREGMVFVTMEQDDVLHRTAQYQIQYAPPNTATPRDRVTFTNTDPRTRFNREPQQTVSVSHNRDGTLTTRAGRSFIYSHDSDVRTPQMPREFTASQPDFRISTEFSDEEDDVTGTFNPAPVSILRRPPPNRIGTLPFENDNEDDDDDGSEDTDPDHDPVTTDFLSDHSLHRLRRGNPASTSTADLIHIHADHHHHHHHSNNTSRHSNALAEAWDAHASATQDAIRAVGGGAMLAPHARFHIEKKKSKCTIRFEPPVAGRFILLKMWSSHHDPGSNIDIQSVIARGFAGPRYFPAVEMR